jgi:hypothetical protein
MTPVLALLTALVISGAGLVDGLRDQHNDAVVVLAALIALQGIALLWLGRGRRGVALRPDLAEWLHKQADATGEPVERLADRCVAAYRAGLVDDREVAP